MENFYNSLASNGNNFITIKEAQQMLEVAWATRDAILFLGDPGIGKTQIVRGFAKKMHQQDSSFLEHPIEKRLATEEPSDIKGVLNFVKDEKNPNIMRTDWAVPKCWPDGKTNPDMKGIIFLDELPQANPQVQNAMYGLIQERCLDNLELPKDMMFVAAGNLPNSNQYVTEMAQAFSSRFTIFYVHAVLDEWAEWAMTHGIVPDIITYLKFNNSKAFYDKKAMEDGIKTFANPRSWEVVSDVLKTNFDEKTKMEYISGRVGSEIATSLFRYLKSKKTYQPVSDILEMGKSFDEDSLERFFGTYINVICYYNSLNKQQKLQVLPMFVEAIGKLKEPEHRAFAAKQLMCLEDSINLIPADLTNKLVNIAFDE